MIDNDKVLGKIRGLLAKAESVAGTPEADTFRQKAFELLAKYGIDEAMAQRTGTKAEIDGDKLMKVTFTVPAQLAEQRLMLVWAIARALHCAGIRIGSNKIQVWGVGRHIKRVQFLHRLLTPQMLDGASKAVPVNPFAEGTNTARGRTNVNGHRAEWMLGFGDTINARLSESERNAASYYDGQAGGNRAALMMLSDQQRAEEAMRKFYPHTTTGKGAQRSYGAGYQAGAAAGRNADVGNSRVGGSKVAIG